MTAGEAWRLLMRAGWRLERRSKGSHVIMRRSGERAVLAIGRLGKHGLSPGQRGAVARAARRVRP